MMASAASLVITIVSLVVLFFIIYGAVRLALKHERLSAQRAQMMQNPGYGTPVQPPYGPSLGHGQQPPYGPPPGYGQQPHS
ncbi:hypothetical protein AB0O28_29290 [Microbispora sp. NPDC088329]|uniref:hypothetical protein n=1 Tax=Microbispora sp. NPDC088329 TaxID=3154869 RepID=UPI003435052D